MTAPMLITHPDSGETKTSQEWADHYGVSKNTLLLRLRQGESVREALGPSREGNSAPAKLYTHAGRTQTASEWAKEWSVSANTVRYRFEKGLQSRPRTLARPDTRASYWLTRRWA